LYLKFLETAQKEENTDAARIFKLAMNAEEEHANNYTMYYQISKIQTI